jgi:hypothetical protein
MINYKDIILIELSDQHIKAIDEYCKEHFPDRYIDQKATQIMLAEKEGINPNFIGMAGEWAFISKATGDESVEALEEFLANRPYWKPDKGDFSKGEITIDVKTKYNKKETVPPLFFNATMESGHLDKGFITDFVFCNYLVPMNTVALMGGLTTEEIKQCGTFLKAGEQFREKPAPVKKDICLVKYQDLNPVQAYLDLWQTT